MRTFYLIILAAASTLAAPISVDTFATPNASWPACGALNSVSVGMNGGSIFGMNGRRDLLLVIGLQGGCATVTIGGGLSFSLDDGSRGFIFSQSYPEVEAFVEAGAYSLVLEGFIFTGRNLDIGATLASATSRVGIEFYESGVPPGTLVSLPFVVPAGGIRVNELQMSIAIDNRVEIPSSGIQSTPMVSFTGVTLVTTAAPVPEPSTIALTACGLGILAFRRRSARTW